MGIEAAKLPDRGLRRPDLVFFLDIDPASVSSRPGYGEERYEVLDLQLRTHAIFLNNLFDPTYWIRIDASRPIPDIASDILAHVLDRLVSRSCPPSAPLEFPVLW